MKKALALASFSIFAFISVPFVALAHPGGHTERTDQVEIREQAQTEAVEAVLSVDERKEIILSQVADRQSTITQEQCEGQDSSLRSAIERLSQSTASVNQSMDVMYERIVWFYETGELNLSDYEERMTTLERAKQDSAAAAATVVSFQFTLDCGASDTGQQLDGFRLSVQSAQKALSSYRTTLVELIGAVRTAATLQEAEKSAESTEEQAGATENE